MSLHGHAYIFLLVSILENDPRTLVLPYQQLGLCFSMRVCQQEAHQKCQSVKAVREELSKTITFLEKLAAELERLNKPVEDHPAE